MKLSSELRAWAEHKCQKVIFHTQQKQRVNKLPSINWRSPLVALLEFNCSKTFKLFSV